MMRTRLASGLLCGAVALLLCRPAAAQSAAPAGADATLVLLQELLRFDSSNPSGDTRQVAQRLTALFDAAGIPNETILAPNGKAAHFIARLKGDGSQRPVLVAAHTDVVPVQKERWSVEPFGGTIKDGFVYGRGALDNKGAVAAFAQAVIRLSKDPGPRARDVIFLAEADEEQGAFNTNWLAEGHWDKIDAEFAINEGGSTVVGPDGQVREMQVTYADKLTLNLRIKAQGPTGHSSRPLPIGETANGQLITALHKLSNYRSEIQLSTSTRAYLQAAAKLNPGPLGEAIQRLLAAEDDAARQAAVAKVVAAERGGWGMEGLMRNTLVITMIQSGVKPNVIPGSAEAVMNARLLPGQTVEAFIAELAAHIDNPRVEIEIINARPKAEHAAYYRQRSEMPPSRLDTDLFAAIAQSAKETWPQVAVLPTIFVASTDATPWRARGVPVYGLGPIPADPESAGRVHGDDERVGVAQVRQGAEFAYRILRRVTTPR